MELSPQTMRVEQVESVLLAQLLGSGQAADWGSRLLAPSSARLRLGAGVWPPRKIEERGTARSSARGPVRARVGEIEG